FHRAIKFSAINQLTGVMNGDYVSSIWLGAFTFSDHFILQAAFSSSYTFFGFVLFQVLCTFSYIFLAQLLLFFFLFSHVFLLNFLHDFLHVFFADARFFAITNISQGQCQCVWLYIQAAVLKIFSQVLTNDVVGFLFQGGQRCAV